MSNLLKNITEIAEQTAERLGFLLVETALKGDNRNRIVELFIDSEAGVTTEDCALMSHEVAAVIENTELITSKYRLDVSSPGVDRPLKYLKQFPKHLNRKFEVIYQNGDSQETMELTGRLTAIEGEELNFKTSKEDIAVNFNQIKTAKVLISF